MKILATGTSSTTETSTGNTILTTTTNDSSGGNVDPCGSNQPKSIDATNTGILLSPNYANNAFYPNNAECTWLIQTGSQEAIKLSFLEFNLEE